MSTGQTQTTPLSILIDHFKNVKERAHGLSLDIKKKKLVTLCEAEWPTFGVGWPREGTFDAELVERIKGIVFGHHGYPDQVPYIIVWQDLVQDPPPWLRALLPASRKKTQALVAKEVEKSGVQDPQPTGSPVLPDSNLYPDLIDLEWHTPPTL